MKPKANSLIGFALAIVFATAAPPLSPQAMAAARPTPAP